MFCQSVTHSDSPQNLYHSVEYNTETTSRFNPFGVGTTFGACSRRRRRRWWCSVTTPISTHRYVVLNFVGISENVEFEHNTQDSRLVGLGSAFLLYNGTYVVIMELEV